MRAISVCVWGEGVAEGEGASLGWFSSAAYTIHSKQTHNKHTNTQQVDVPLGSVRASLGWFSTWEDCYALVKFIEGRYKDKAHEP